jgi:hypothetical protein
MGKCASYGAVESHTSLQEHFIPDRALSFHFREVVLGDCIDQAGKNVLAPLALLLRDADV